MLTNQDMTPNRFLRWHKARQRIAWIKARLAEGATVQLTTYTRATRYTAKHAEMFRATKTGALVQRGKRWDCIDGCDVRAFN